MKLEDLPVHTNTENYKIRYNKVDDKTIFYYAHINNQLCSVKPYEVASQAIEWAEDEVSGKL
jgi:hypothetical protein